MLIRASKILVVSFSIILGTMSGARALISLDFTEVGATGIVPLTVINLSNATLFSFGNDFFIGAPGAFGEVNNLGVVHANTSDRPFSFRESSFMIDFPSLVENLRFSGFGGGFDRDGSLESVTVSFFRGFDCCIVIPDSFLFSATITEAGQFNVAFLGPMDRIIFEVDFGTPEGIAWGDFLFDVVPIPEPPITIPEPSTLALFAFGLAGLGFMSRRRRIRCRQT